MLLIKSTYPLKCLQRDRIVVQEIRVSSQLSCKPQKNVSQHLKVEMYPVQYQFVTVVKSMISEQQDSLKLDHLVAIMGKILYSKCLSYKWVPAKFNAGGNAVMD